MNAEALRAGTAPRLRPAVAPILAVTTWAVLLLAGHRLGADLEAVDPRVHVGAPPLVGSADLRVGLRVLPVLALALAAVFWGPQLAERLSFQRLLVASWAGLLTWMTVLAATDGLSTLATPLTRRFEYLAVVPRIDTPGSFLHRFVDQLATYPTHVKGHPPGLPLLLWSLDQIGLGGRWPATILVLAVGALVAPAALVALRELSDNGAARRAAPFLVLTPGAEARVPSRPRSGVRRSAGRSARRRG